jgi:hypothetical protein
MKAICRKTTSKDFDLTEITTVFINDFDYSYGGSGLELGKEYLIMGLMVYKNENSLYYLVDVSGKPDWFPYLLFEISDNNLPKHWFINVKGKKSDDEIYAIWGFDELCNDESFYYNLIERDEQAVRTYFRRKIEFEKAHE